MYNLKIKHTVNHSASDHQDQENQNKFPEVIIFRNFSFKCSNKFPATPLLCFLHPVVHPQNKRIKQQGYKDRINRLRNDDMYQIIAEMESSAEQKQRQIIQYSV